MSSTIPIAFRLRLLLTLCAAVLGLLLFAACSAEPTPTPTPTATPTPTPTPVPTATPTPEPAPAAPAEITLFSPASAVLGMLSEQEQTCIGGKVGQAAYQGMLDQPLASVVTVPGQLDMILDCMEPANAAELAIIGIGAVAGGFADESAMCLRALYTTAGVSNFPLEWQRRPAGDPPGPPLLPLSDRRGSAGALPVHGHSHAIPPSALRCVDEQIGLEQFLPAMAGDLTQLPPQAMQVMQAL